MDSYLIRIYRRNPDEPNDLVGIVENTDTGQRESFNSLAGMCQAVSVTNPDRKHSPGRVKPDKSQKPKRNAR